jgi:hypothetical protein
LDIRVTARAFIAGAFEELRKEFVLPTPVFHPYVRAGRDYFCDTIRRVPAFHELEKRLDELYPQRFAEPLKRGSGAQFSTTYIFDFLEAAIARCGCLAYHDEQDHFDPESDAVSETIDELFSVLDAPDYEVVCCRFVSHIATEGNREITLGDITIVPEPPGFGGLTDRIAHEIAGGWSAFNRDDPRPFDKPHALVIVRERTDDPEPYKVGERLSSKLERFLLLARLFSASTVYSMFEVRGNNSPRRGPRTVTVLTPDLPIWSTLTSLLAVFSWPSRRLCSMDAPRSAGECRLAPLSATTDSKDAHSRSIANEGAAIAGTSIRPSSSPQEVDTNAHEVRTSMVRWRSGNGHRIART